MNRSTKVPLLFLESFTDKETQASIYKVKIDTSLAKQFEGEPPRALPSAVVTYLVLFVLDYCDLYDIDFDELVENAVSSYSEGVEHDSEF